MAPPPWDTLALGVAETLGITMGDARGEAPMAQPRRCIWLYHPPAEAGPTADHVAVLMGPGAEALLWHQASGMALETLLAVRFPHGAEGSRRT